MVESRLVITLNSFVAHHPYLAEIVSLLASDSAFFLIGILFYFWFKTKASLKRVHRDMIIVAVCSGLLARYPLKMIVASWVHRARPYVAYSDITPLAKPPLHEEFLSFPSGHALFFFAVATVVFIHHKKLGVIFYGISAVMVCARVFAGLHYFSDILLGAFLGVCTALLFMRLTKKILPL